MINSRFAIAVHLLALVQAFPDTAQSSAELAGSIGVNAVVVRQVSQQLRRAELVATHKGKAGLRLTRPATQITLLDVYQAVQTEPRLIGLHEHPNPACPVGASIQAALDSVNAQAQLAFETQLARQTVADVTADVLRRAAS